jgi:hypothetical protein
MMTDRVEVVASKFVMFRETGQPPPGLFSAEVFCDFTMPTWRLQARGVRDVVALRLAGHPVPGQVPRQRLDPTPTGFVLEVEETWEKRGELWYCRELFRADVIWWVGHDGALAAVRDIRGLHYLRMLLE